MDTGTSRKSCRTKIRRGSQLASIAAFAAMWALADATSGANSQPDATTAERLVEEAQQAELSGNSGRQFALLRQAVRIAPDYELPRWQLGQVQVDGEWLAIEEAQRRAAADPKQAEYRRLRAKNDETPEGQLSLARWCQTNDLEEEARFHWASVLSTEPNHKEALRALDMRWFEGRLLAREDVKREKKQAGGARRAARQWSAAVAGWARALSKIGDSTPSEVFDEIRAVTEVDAIPAFEQVTLGGEQSSDSGREPIRKLSLAFLGALEAMTDHAATQSLVRHAVLSEFSDVRQDATDKLRYRPLHDYVPFLLDGLSARIESSYRVVVDNDGSVHHLHSIYREGPFADWSYRAARSIHLQSAPARIAARLAAASEDMPTTPDVAREARTAVVSAAAAMRSARRYQQEAAVAQQQIAQANEASAALNERIVSVLASVTDQDLGVEPRAWWDWWQSHNEYDVPDERPVYESQDVTNEYVIPAPPQCECFARGTPVWTKMGQQPIETLELGDLVLAQDVETGELAYKPVIRTTVRPPSALMKVSYGGEELLTTRGHPFWVAGVGWRMSKELGDGATLHGVSGTARVESIEPASEAEAYNLVVADFNTYFVGKSGIRVHDNTPRRPTRATVPGLPGK